MDPALKHRLIGAAVLSAIAIIFLPMLMVGRDTNDTAASVPLKVPAAPDGDFQTKELPLVTPAPGVPNGGVVGLDTTHPAPAASAASSAAPSKDASGSGSPAGAVSPPATGAASPASAASGPSNPASPAASPSSATASNKLPAPPPAASGKSATATSPATASPGASTAAAQKPATSTVTPVSALPTAAASPAALPNQPSGPIPAANAGGHFVVSLGTYSSAANAQSLVASLSAKQLPAYAETVTVAGKTATRVRIGPFQQRGDAETARLQAQQIRTDMSANVVALDAAAPAPAAASNANKSATAPGTPAKPGTAAAATAIRPAASPANATPAVATASSAGDQPSIPSPAAAGRGYVVQVSAFRSESEAVTLRNKLRAAGFTAFSEKVDAESGTLFRVRIGPEANRDDADHLRTELSAKLGLSGMVVAYP